MRATRWIIVVVGLVALVVALRLTVLAPKVVEVQVSAADVGLVEETVTNTRAGTVKVRRRAKLSPQLGGLVVALPHREGEWVEAGTLLLELDNRAQLANLELARRDVLSYAALADEACLAAELAEKELDRVEALHGSGIASDQSRDTLRTERDRSIASCVAARAIVEQSQARVAVASVQLQFTELRAPFAGTVAEISIEVGEWITPAPPGVPIPPVIDLLDPESVYISAPIDEVDAERVRVGQPARITVDSRPDAVYVGRLERVAPYVLDVLEQNRTVEVEVGFEELSRATGILPGTSADVELILDRRDSVLRIPAAAIAEGSKVLVLTGEVLEERTVTVGLRNWQVAEIMDGLEEGDLVVATRHSTDIRAGARAVAK